MVDVPTNIKDIENLRSYSKRQQISWINKSYQERTNWLAQGSIRGGGEFVRSGFSDAHFPLELIQNADDEGATAMRFERDAASKQIRVYDNGSGFNLQGVVAVCQQGRSRKQSDKQIGFMGIGFKSLFEVCDRVEIHSNGYHFEFQTKRSHDQEGTPGFLVPEWIENAERTTSYQPDGDDPNEYTTAIIGHLSDADAVIKPLQKTNLSPSVFLFLNNLKTLRIRDSQGKINRDLGGDRGLNTHLPTSEIEDLYQKYTPSKEDKLDQGQNSASVEIRELSENGETQRYVLFRNVWQPGDIERPQFRENLDRSDLFVALRVNDDCEICESDGSIRISPIHSYLPVKQFDGIDVDFVLHADFDLTLNRQGVQQKSPWNEQIVQELRRQVLEPAAKTIAEHDSLHRQLEFIIPKESGGDGLILNDLLAEFTTTLQSMELVRVAGIEDQELVQPTNAAFVTDEARQQFTSTEIHEAVGLWPVIDSQKAVLERLNEDTRYELRHLLEKTPDSLLAENKDVEWFSNMYETLIDETSRSEIDELSPEDVNPTRATLEKLKGNIIPTQDGSRVGGEGGSRTPLRGVKIPPQSGYDEFDAQEANKVISSPVADEELFSGEHGDLVRELLIEAGADELADAEILIEAATEGSIDETNISVIMQAYADEERIEKPAADWFRNVDWEEAAKPSLLKQIQTNPEPDKIVDTIETWMSENWRDIPSTARRETLRYLFTAGVTSVAQFEGVSLPTKDNHWIQPRMLLFPPEFEPEYDYEALWDTYEEVMSSQMEGFVDPNLIAENTEDCRDTLKTIGVCNEEVNGTLSGKIGEKFVQRYLENKGTDLIGLSDPVGRDFEDIDGHCYEVKSSTARKNKIELDGPQAEKINNSVGSETEYTLITVAYSLTPERTEIQDKASAEEIVSQRETIVYKP